MNIDNRTYFIVTNRFRNWLDEQTIDDDSITDATINQFITFALMKSSFKKDDFTRDEYSVCISKYLSYFQHK